jgi:soluble lytic murein transglycosylase
MRCIAGLVAVALVACKSSREASAAGDVAAAGAGALSTNAGLARAIAANDELTVAQAAIDAGHPWRATQTLAPLLRNPSKRSPAVLIVAGRAAAGWGGWTEVDKLLLGQSWIDTLFDGEARQLLTQSALERGADANALEHASAAVRNAKTDDARAARLVLLARALERNNSFDSAAAAYAKAAETSGILRPVRDWLLLRAANVQRDSSARAREFAGVALPVARQRIAWTEAQARERFGDAAGAAQRYAALGATVAAIRLRLSAASDSATRDALKAELLAYIRGRNAAADVRSAIDLLDKSFPRLAPAEELAVARGASVAGPPARAVSGYGRAAAQLTPGDRFGYAQSLSRVGRAREAMAQFDSVEGPMAGQAAYARARVLLTSGTADATRTALRGLVTKFPHDTAAAGAALFLLADLVTDDGGDTQARAIYQQLYREYPTSARAPEARFNAAMIALTAGDAPTAAKELDSLVLKSPRAEDATAARYWSGRAWAAAGDQTLAATRWRDVIRLQPTSYYAFMSQRQLGGASWTPSGAGEQVSHVSAVDNAIARAVMLERLGMDVEARFEYDALDDAANKMPERSAATAAAFAEHGQTARSIHIAQRLVDSGRRDAATYRLLFPLIDQDELTHDAKARALDPALVAGIIRQESGFNPRAVSIANARGLMQLLPSVGQEVSRNTSFVLWHPALLLDPDANLQLGTAHLASYFKQYGAVPRVLAAYNAGGSRVTRWIARPGTDDQELFAERIPFAETRDYVRIVQRNAQVYRVLYDW